MYVKTLMNQIPTVYYRKKIDVEEAAFVAIHQNLTATVYRERYPLDYCKDHAEVRTTTKSYAVGSMYKVYMYRIVCYLSDSEK